MHWNHITLALSHQYGGFFFVPSLASLGFVICTQFKLYWTMLLQVFSVLCNFICTMFDGLCLMILMTILHYKYCMRLYCIINITQSFKILTLVVKTYCSRRNKLMLSPCQFLPRFWQLPKLGFSSSCNASAKGALCNRILLSHIDFMLFITLGLIFLITSYIFVYRKTYTFYEFYFCIISIYCIIHI